MHQKRRLELIEKVAVESGLVTVDELVDSLQASPATVRRDIAMLADAGRVRRVRGGVEPALPPPAAELLTAPFEQSRLQNQGAKRAIARRAAELCATGESIIVNGGTTTYAMADFIADRRLNVLTNSFAFASHLTTGGNCRVTVPGGEIYRAQNVIVSAYESDTVIDHFYASRMFTGAQAIRSQGMIEGDPLLIKTERMLLNQADKLVVLVDGSKFAPKGSLILCPLSRIDLLITDSSAPAEALAMLADQGVTVEVVEVDKEVDVRGVGGADLAGVS